MVIEDLKVNFVAEWHLNTKKFAIQHVNSYVPLYTLIKGFISLDLLKVAK